MESEKKTYDLHETPTGDAKDTFAIAIKLLRDIGDLLTDNACITKLDVHIEYTCSEKNYDKDEFMDFIQKSEDETKRKIDALNEFLEQQVSEENRRWLTEDEFNQFAEKFTLMHNSIWNPIYNDAPDEIYDYHDINIIFDDHRYPYKIRKVSSSHPYIIDKVELTNHLPAEEVPKSNPVITLMDSWYYDQKFKGIKLNRDTINRFCAELMEAWNSFYNYTIDLTKPSKITMSNINVYFHDKNIKYRLVRDVSNWTSKFNKTWKIVKITTAIKYPPDESEE